MLNDQTIKLELDLRNGLTRALRKNSSWGKLFGDFIELLRKKRLNAYLFGGTVRDLLLVNVTEPPRDLDIVVDDGSFDFFRHDLATDEIKQNRFGGLKCKFRSLEIDVWPLKSTWAFQKGYRDHISFASLPSTTFFNLDAVVAEIAPAKGVARKVFDCGFFNGVLHKRIECNLTPTEYPELNAVRGFVLGQKTGFHFGNGFCRFLFDLVYVQRRTDFEAVQLQHYKRVRVPQNILMSNVDEMRKLLNKNPESTFQPKFPRTTQKEFGFDPEPPCFEFAKP